MAQMSKRRRISFGEDEPLVQVIRRTAKRPINKRLVAARMTGLTSLQMSTTLRTFTFPGTVTGIRWSISFSNVTINTETPYFWAIIIVKDGKTQSVMATSDAADFYDPEEECLVFGTLVLTPTGDPVTVNGSTKTMRKMNGGDQLMLIAIGKFALETANLDGIVQFFIKT